MSLLSGIRFVAREERDTIAAVSASSSAAAAKKRKHQQASSSSSSSSSSSDSSSESSDDSDEERRKARRRHHHSSSSGHREKKDKKEKKEKKDKKKKKHSKKEHKHKHHKKHQHREKEEQHKDESSESEVDMHALAREEEERERAEWLQKMKRDEEENKRHRFGTGYSDEEEEDGAEETQQQEVFRGGMRAEKRDEEAGFDPNRFRSLLSSLGGKSSSNPVSSNTSSRQSASSSNLHAEPNTAPAVTTSTEPAATSEPATNNKSMAALLRARLKTAGTKALDANVIEKDKQALESGESILADDFDLKKQMMLVNTKYNSSVQEQAAKGKKANKDQKSDYAQVDLKTLIGREKYGADEDMDSIYRDNILRLGDRYKGTELGGTGAFGNGDRAGMDEEANIDMKMFERKTVDPMEAMKRQVAAAAKERQRMANIVENCQFCFNSKRFPRQLLLSKSENVIVRLKTEAYALADGHVEIIPLSHVSSYVKCDEETKVEIERYKQCLRRFYEQQGKNMVVIETAVNFDRRPHACIEVIPIERGIEAEIQMFFKEAFLSCDEEWAQHKKVIEITADRPLTKAIPTQFSYLYVEWLIAGNGEEVNNKSVTGLVHPIENDKSIHFAFCYDVLAGMLEEDEFRMRKGKPVQPGMEAKKAQQFKKDFETYDWTQYQFA